jgi:hypothetical protein
MVAPIRTRKVTCEVCKGKSFYYEYCEETGLSARVDCDYCENGEINIEY